MHSIPQLPITGGTRCHRPRWGQLCACRTAWSTRIGERKFHVSLTVSPSIETESATCIHDKSDLLVQYPPQCPPKQVDLYQFVSVRVAAPGVVPGIYFIILYCRAVRFLPTGDQEKKNRGHHITMNPRNQETYLHYGRRRKNVPRSPTFSVNFCIRARERGCSAAYGPRQVLAPSEFFGQHEGMPKSRAHV